MNLAVYNQKGKKTGTQEVPANLFSLPKNDSLVHQVYTVKWNNLRRPYAHTKTRGEVRGGGRKPWRQKGTGRARHGSTRSPIWVGGGVTFGPRNDRNYKRATNKKMNRKAIFTVLSSKANDNTIYVVDTLEFKEAKTKVAAEMLTALGLEGKSSVIYGNKEDKNYKRAFRNIPKIKPASLDNLNIVDLLQKQNIIISKPAMDELVNTYKDKVKATEQKPKEQEDKKTKKQENKKSAKTSKKVATATK